MQLNGFYKEAAAFPAVLARMYHHWAGYAGHWAWWGRLDVLDLGCNTNNLVERGFGMLKYDDLGGKTQSTLQQLFDVLMRTTTPRYMRLRALLLADRIGSDQRQQAQRMRQWVAHLVATGAVQPMGDGGFPGGATVKSTHSETARLLCLADLTCSCEYSGEQGLGGARREGAQRGPRRRGGRAGRRRPARFPNAALTAGHPLQLARCVFT
jgi:hypothetical protein